MIDVRRLLKIVGVGVGTSALSKNTPELNVKPTFSKWLRNMAIGLNVMDELKFQARVVAEAKRVKGWARKIGNIHQAGTPDLFIKLFGLESVLLECKLKDLKKLTKIQRENIHRLHVAGQPCGWLVMVQERTVYNCFVGADRDAELPVTNENCTMITYTGRNWDIGEIVVAVHYWSQREMDKLG